MSTPISYPILLPDGAFLVEAHRENYPKILEVLEEAFPHTSRNFFYCITLQDPEYHPSFSLAVQKENRFLAHVQIFDRTLEFRDYSLRLGGIGCVAARPECRGQGYASALMNHAVTVMQSSGMEAGMLYTSIHPFYERLEWKTLVQWEQSITIELWKNSGSMIGQYRPLSDSDYPVLAAMYQSQQQRCQGTLRRSMEYWRMRPMWMSHPCVIVLCQGRIAGYFYAAKYKQDESVLTIAELGVADSTEETLDRMFAVMARKAMDLQCDTLRGFFLHDPIIRDFLHSRQWITGEREFRYVMWRDWEEPHFNIIQKLAHEKRFLYWQTDAF